MPTPVRSRGSCHSDPTPMKRRCPVPTKRCFATELFVRRLFALYTAQLLCRLVVYNFSSERDYNFDKWIWLSTWNTEKSRGEFWERRGRGLEAPIKASGMLWIPRDLIDWRRGHVALATLIDLYIPRSPLQSRLTSQKNIQGLSTTQLTVEYIVQEWVQEAGEAFQEHRDQKGHELADRIAGLCAEETAREYNLHLLDKMQSYWDPARAKAGYKGRKLPASLPRLQRAREDVVADRSLPRMRYSNHRFSTDQDTQPSIRERQLPFSNVWQLLVRRTY
ncbi:hypothetical protein VCV18_012296 [Metarhizium anisopliae]